MGSIRHISVFRFRVGAGTFAMLLVAIYVGVARPFGSELDVFAVLLALLVLAGISLWPRNDEERSVERKLTRRNWADRIKFEEPD